MVFYVSVLKIFGIFPTNGNRNLEILYKFVLLLGYYVLLGLALGEKNENKEVSNVVNTAVSLSLTMTLTSLVVNSLMNKSKILHVYDSFRLLNTFTAEVIQLNGKPKRDTILATILSVFITGLLIEAVITDYVIFVQTYVLETRMKFVINFIAIFIISYFFFSFGVTAYLIHQKFLLINYCLESIVIHGKTKKIKQFSTMFIQHNSTYNMEMLKKLKTVNDQLRTQVNELLSCFSLPVFTNSVTVFFVTTTNVYYLIDINKYSLMNYNDLPRRMKQMIESGNTNEFINKQIKISVCLVNFVVIHVLQLIIPAIGIHFVRKQMRLVSKNLNKLSLENFDLMQEVSERRSLVY